MKPIVITQAAINCLAGLNYDTSWLTDGPDPEIAGVRFVDRPAALHIIAPQDVRDSPLLIISGHNNRLFGSLPDSERRQVLDRLFRVALRGFGSPVKLNPRWMPYHAGNRVSVFGSTFSHNRIVVEVHPNNDRHVFAFVFSPAEHVQDMAKLQYDSQEYASARDDFAAACAEDVRNGESEMGDIQLNRVEPADVSQGFTYHDWFPRHVSIEQRRFIEHPVVGPIRLRGGAGTGKTLAMALKALKTKIDADVDQAAAPVRILFVTHSWAMAEQVDRLISKLAPGGTTGESTIDVFPLLALAQKRDYSSIGRQPLGLDNDDGKRLALAEIGSVIDRFTQGDWLAYRDGVSVEFRARLEAANGTRERKLLSWDLLLEFGCVIAAQGILTHNSDRERYLRIKRLRWMMPLNNQSDKITVFALWRMFMDTLREKALIASDQIISDYLNDLSTFYWEAARRKEGYDVIFVDEMHLFNAQERLIFHNLLTDGDKSPQVIMALDPKQSPRETFVNVTDEDGRLPSNIFEAARLPNSEKIEFTQVYRYTPQIAKLVKYVHQQAPALDLSDEWDIPSGESSQAVGPVPEYSEQPDALKSFRFAMSKALEWNKEIRAANGRVAVLCMDDERFSRYVDAAGGQHGKETMILSSRDDSERLRYSTRQIVFSTPEYVAGLQFDSVILLDVNKDQVPEGKFSAYHLRRFLSELYLGVTRAERRILLIASKDEGGLSTILDKARDDGALVASG